MSIVSVGQQHSINFCGNQIECDGIWGPESRANAIRCLQVACNHDYGSGLEVDGIFGIATSSAINGHYVKYGETQYLVTFVEIALMMRGYDTNGVECPGTFGDGLYNAVCSYQREHGLIEDGIAGTSTICSLCEVDNSSSGDSGEWSQYDPNNLPNFDPNEFKCKCGCGRDVCDELKQKAQLLRDKIGMPMTITDGFRCPTYNAQEGGTSTSLHMQGKAFDMQIYKNGTYHMTDSDQDYYRELAHQCGLTTGNYYGDGGGWMHCQIGRNDYNEWY